MSTDDALLKAIDEEIARQGETTTSELERENALLRLRVKSLRDETERLLLWLLGLGVLFSVLVGH